jgi:transposase
MADFQLRCEPRAGKIFDDARSRGHTQKAEAMGILKRHLSDVAYRRMIQVLKARPATTERGAARRLLT